MLIPLAVVAVLLVGRGNDESAAAQPAAAREAAATEKAADPHAGEEEDAHAGEEEDAKGLRRQWAVRDKKQIKELTDRARTIADDVTPAVAGMGKTLPPGEDTIGPLASPADVEKWRRAVREADAYFSETVSGETATNVARNGMGSAVGVLREAVETYSLALTEAGARDALLRRAAAQRDLAARAWSAAAVQLDVINIDAGYGHQHVTFPSSGGEGAVAPDDLPEGTDAREP